jgi:hypothetical protein
LNVGMKPITIEKHMKITLAVLLALCAGCAGKSSDAAKPVNTGGNPFQEAAELGATKYVGAARVASTSVSGNETSYTFDPASGPVCMRGTEFSASVRETPSDSLLIYIQGGGACWSGLCMTLETADKDIPRMDILDPNMQANPFRDWDVLYIPYCDGSLHAGDVDTDMDGDGVAEVLHRGLRNDTAALELGLKHFPKPSRIALAGSSAGGFGTIFMPLLLRALYPGVELMVINDAGVGILKGSDPGFVKTLMDEWKVTQRLPASCKDCLGNGHMTRLIEWELEHDPALRVGIFSTYSDLVIAEVYFQVPGAEFKKSLQTESARLHARFPGRYSQFLVDGNFHTVLSREDRSDPNSKGIDNVLQDGISFAEWMRLMRDKDRGWGPRMD